MSIKNGSSVSAQFIPTAALVDQNGIPTTAYGRGFLQATWVRGGSGTGIVPVVSAPLTAAGTTIETALQLAEDWNNVATAAAGSGVAIAAQLNLQPGNDIWVFNAAANTVKVYPPSPTTQIDALGNGTPYSLTPGKLRCFKCWAATQFHSYGN